MYQSINILLYIIYYILIRGIARRRDEEEYPCRDMLKNNEMAWWGGASLLTVSGRHDEVGTPCRKPVEKKGTARWGGHHTSPHPVVWQGQSFSPSGLVVGTKTSLCRSSSRVANRQSPPPWKTSISARFRGRRWRQWTVHSRNPRNWVFILDSEVVQCCGGWSGFALSSCSKMAWRRQRGFAPSSHQNLRCQTH